MHVGTSDAHAAAIVSGGGNIDLASLVEDPPAARKTRAGRVNRLPFPLCLVIGHIEIHGPSLGTFVIYDHVIAEVQGIDKFLFHGLPHAYPLIDF